MKEITVEYAEHYLGVIPCTSESLRYGNLVPRIPGQVYYVTDLGQWLVYTGGQDDVPQNGPRWIGWRTVDPGRLVTERGGRGVVASPRVPVAPEYRRALHTAHGLPGTGRQSSYRGVPAQLPAGRTYGSDARKPLPRLASKMRRVWWWLGISLGLFALLFVVLFVRAAALAGPPAFVPLPTPTPSPHEEVPVWQRIPDGGVRPQ